jgi:glycosyltransferase involved in cell wall biosynthesis
MIIAVNTRFLLKNRLEGYGYFIREIFSRLAVNYPEHQFYFLFDRPFDPSFVFAPNVTPLVVSPPARHPVLWKYWYDFRIPMVLRRIRADVFVSTDSICSLTTRVPQCLVVHDLGIIHFPKDYKKSHRLYFSRYLPKFFKKARSLATVSQFSKTDITARYKLDPNRVRVVYSAAKEVFEPVFLEEQEKIRKKWTGGLPYFIYVGAIHPRKNLISLLKAFSLFKKRLQSNMKLVLLGRQLWKNEEFAELLGSYKYRSEVVLTEYLEETEVARLVGAAYALVYPSLFEGFGVPVLEAMKCGVPALTSANSSMQEIAGGAALYFDPLDPKDIADKMMQIYKDESLRNQLIQKGFPIAAHYSWDRTADLLWECIREAAGG